MAEIYMMIEVHFAIREIGKECLQTERFLKQFLGQEEQ
jgi:hypothetical protein